MISNNFVQNVLDKSDIAVSVAFDNCLIVAVRLPNNYVITECAVFYNKEEFKQDLGYRTCMKHIKDKIRDLEAYIEMDKIAYGTFLDNEYVEE